jgi:hypothetical protein
MIGIDLSKAGFGMLGIRMYPCPHKVNYVTYAFELWLYNSSDFAIQHITTKFLLKNILTNNKEICQILTIHSQGEVQNDLRGGVHLPPQNPAMDAM